MTEAHLHRVPDAGILRELPGGLVIVRRMKHEWRDDLDSMASKQLTLRTGKKWGSKFLRTWTLNRLVDWMSEQITAAGWHRQNQPFAPLDVRLDEAVGLADGGKVHTIRTVCDGLYVHAYPLKD